MTWTNIKERDTVAFAVDTETCEGTVAAGTRGIVAQRGQFIVRVMLDTGQFATLTTHDPCTLRVV